MEQVQGTVEAVKKDGRGFKLQGDGWYSAFKAEMLNGAKKGDEVEFNYKMNGQWKNVEGSVRVIGAGQAPQASGGGGSAPRKNFGGGGGNNARSFPVGKTEGGRAINRQNALTNAVNFIINKETKAGITPEGVIEVARYFESYTCGDMDLEEAEGYTDQ